MKKLISALLLSLVAVLGTPAITGSAPYNTHLSGPNRSPARAAAPSAAFAGAPMLAAGPIPVTTAVTVTTATGQLLTQTIASTVNSWIDLTKGTVIIPSGAGGTLTVGSLIGGVNVGVTPGSGSRSNTVTLNALQNGGTIAGPLSITAQGMGNTLTVTSGTVAPVIVGGSTYLSNYNAISLNGLTGSNSLGMVGGGLNDPNLYLMAPTGGGFQLQTQGSGPYYFSGTGATMPGSLTVGGLATAGIVVNNSSGLLSTTTSVPSGSLSGPVSTALLPPPRLLSPLPSIYGVHPVASTFSVSPHIASPNTYTYSPGSPTTPLRWLGADVSGIDGQAFTAYGGAAAPAAQAMIGVTFNTTSQHVEFHLKQPSAGGSLFQLFVNGQIASEVGVPTGGDQSMQWIQYTFPSRTSGNGNLITLWMNGTELDAVNVDTGDSITPPPALDNLVGVIGDSFTEGTDVFGEWWSWEDQMLDILGWKPIHYGLGGTGYMAINPGSGRTNLFPTLRKLFGGLPTTGTLSNAGAGYNTFGTNFQANLWTAPFGSTYTITATDSASGVASITWSSVAGYSVGQELLLETDAGQGTSAVFKVTAVDGSGRITGVSQANPGFDYSTAGTGLLRTMGGQEGVVWVTSTTSGAVAGYTIRGSGWGYTPGSTLYFVPPGVSSTSSAGITTYAQYTVSTSSTLSPKRVIFAHGLNDTQIFPTATYLQNIVSADMAELDALAKANSVTLDERIALAPFLSQANADGTTNQTGVNTVSSVIQAAAAAQPAPWTFLPTIGILTGTHGGMQGNANWAVGSDGTHPNGVAGHGLWALGLFSRWQTAHGVNGENPLSLLAQNAPRILSAGADPTATATSPISGLQGDFLVRTDNGQAYVNQGGGAGFAPTGNPNTTTTGWSLLLTPTISQAGLTSITVSSPPSLTLVNPTLATATNSAGPGNPVSPLLEWNTQVWSGGGGGSSNTQTMGAYLFGLPGADAAPNGGEALIFADRTGTSFAMVGNNDGYLTGSGSKYFMIGSNVAPFGGNFFGFPKNTTVADAGIFLGSLANSNVQQWFIHANSATTTSPALIINDTIGGFDRLTITQTSSANATATGSLNLWLNQVNTPTLNVSGQATFTGAAVTTNTFSAEVWIDPVTGHDTGTLAGVIGQPLLPFATPQAAQAAVISASKSSAEFWVAGGTITFAAPLLLPPTIPERWHGAGRGVTVFKAQTQLLDQLVRSSDTSTTSTTDASIEFIGFTFDGNGAAQTTGYYPMIWINGSQHFSFTDCEYKNPQRYAILLTNCSDGNVTGAWYNFNGMQNQDGIHTLGAQNVLLQDLHGITYDDGVCVGDSESGWNYGGGLTAGSYGRAFKNVTVENQFVGNGGQTGSSAGSTGVRILTNTNGLANGPVTLHNITGTAVGFGIYTSGSGTSTLSGLVMSDISVRSAGGVVFNFGANTGDTLLTNFTDDAPPADGVVMLIDSGVTVGPLIINGFSIHSNGTSGGLYGIWNQGGFLNGLQINGASYTAVTQSSSVPDRFFVNSGTYSRVEINNGNFTGLNIVATLSTSQPVGAVLQITDSQQHQGGGGTFTMVNVQTSVSAQVISMTDDVTDASQGLISALGAAGATWTPTILGVANISGTFGGTSTYTGTITFGSNTLNLFPPYVIQNSGTYSQPGGQYTYQGLAGSSIAIQWLLAGSSGGVYNEFTTLTESYLVGPSIDGTGGSNNPFLIYGATDGRLMAAFNSHNQTITLNAPNGLTLTGSATFTGTLTVSGISAGAVSNTIFVDQGSGHDTGTLAGVIGQPNLPFKTVSAAFAVATPGSTIYLRGNYTYATGNTLTFPSGGNVTLKGDGQFTTTVSSAANLNAFLLTNANNTTTTSGADSNITIEDLTIDGNGANQSGAWGGTNQTTFFQGVANMTVQRVQGAGAKGYNFHFANCPNGVANQVFFIEADNGQLNRDGLHFNSCVGWTVTDIGGKTYDDMVAVLADEYGYTPTIATGSTANMIVSSVIGQDNSGTNNFSEGVRIDGNSAGAFRIFVSNVTGKFARNGVSIDSTYTTSSVVDGVVLSNIDILPINNGGLAIAVESPVQGLTVYGANSTQVQTIGGQVSIGIQKSTFTNWYGLVNDLTLIGGQFEGSTSTASFVGNADLFIGALSGVNRGKLIGLSHHDSSNAHTVGALLYVVSTGTYGQMTLQNCSTENLDQMVNLLGDPGAGAVLNIFNSTQTGAATGTHSMVQIAASTNGRTINVLNDTTDGVAGLVGGGSGFSYAPGLFGFNTGPQIGTGLAEWQVGGSNEIFNPAVTEARTLYGAVTGTTSATYSIGVDSTTATGAFVIKDLKNGKISLFTISSSGTDYAAGLDFRGGIHLHGSSLIDNGGTFTDTLGAVVTGSLSSLSINGITLSGSGTINTNTGSITLTSGTALLLAGTELVVGSNTGSVTINGALTVTGAFTDTLSPVSTITLAGPLGHAEIVFTDTTSPTDYLAISNTNSVTPNGILISAAGTDSFSSIVLTPKVSGASGVVLVSAGSLNLSSGVPFLAATSTASIGTTTISAVGSGTSGVAPFSAIDTFSTSSAIAQFLATSASAGNTFGINIGEQASANNEVNLGFLWNGNTSTTNAFSVNFFGKAAFLTATAGGGMALVGPVNVTNGFLTDSFSATAPSSISLSAASGQGLSITNSSTASGASAQINVGNSANFGDFVKLGTGNTYKFLGASGFAFLNNTAGRISILNDWVGGDIALGTNASSTPQWVMDTSGNVTQTGQLTISTSSGIALTVGNNGSGGTTITTAGNIVGNQLQAGTFLGTNAQINSSITGSATMSLGGLITAAGGLTVTSSVLTLTTSTQALAVTGTSSFVGGTTSGLNSAAVLVTGTSSGTPGILGVTNFLANSPTIIGLLAPNLLTVTGTAYMQLGVAESNFNLGLWGFSYAGSGSTSNAMVFEFYGQSTPDFSVNGLGSATLSGGLFTGTESVTTLTASTVSTSGAATIGGALTVTGSSTHAGTTTIGSASADYFELTGSATDASLLGVGSASTFNVIVTPKGNGRLILGTNTWAKSATTSAADSLTLDNGGSDTPNVTFYYANNKNFSIDALGGSMRFIADADESTGGVIGSWSTTALTANASLNVASTSSFGGLVMLSSSNPTLTSSGVEFMGGIVTGLFSATNAASFSSTVTFAGAVSMSSTLSVATLLTVGGGSGITLSVSPGGIFSNGNIQTSGHYSLTGNSFFGPGTNGNFGAIVGSSATNSGLDIGFTTASGVGLALGTPNALVIVSGANTNTFNDVTTATASGATNRALISLGLASSTTLSSTNTTTASNVYGLYIGTVTNGTGFTGTNLYSIGAAGPVNWTGGETTTTFSEANNATLSGTTITVPNIPTIAGIDYVELTTTNSLGEAAIVSDPRAKDIAAGPFPHGLADLDAAVDAGATIAFRWKTPSPIPGLAIDDNPHLGLNAKILFNVDPRFVGQTGGPDNWLTVDMDSIRAQLAWHMQSIRELDAKVIDAPATQAQPDWIARVLALLALVVATGAWFRKPR